MTLAELTATALPDGNKIAVTWRPDKADDSVGFRVIRRTVAYPDPKNPAPQAPSQGVVIADSTEETTTKTKPMPMPLSDGRFVVADRSLIDGTVYYYHVFPFTVDEHGERKYDEDERNRVSAAATGKHGFSARMYGLLPEVYRRFDTASELSRFLDVIGGQFDQMYSAVRSIPDLMDASTVDGKLLPLLAEWIGWRTNFSAGYDRQRFDIRAAMPLYHSTQTLGAVQAGVRRATGWDTVCKEFVDNVAITNRPERHNLWLIAPGADPGDQPLSFDEMFASRAAVAATGNRPVMVYVTNRSRTFEIRQKEHVDGAWQPSTVVVPRQQVDRDPAIVCRITEKTVDGARVETQTLWLFWATLHPDTGWSIEFTKRTAGDRWSEPSKFNSGSSDSAERRSPAVLVDENGALWVFWCERQSAAAQWALRYQRFTGDELAPTPTNAKTFPNDGNAEPRVESDLSVLLYKPQSGGGSPRILVLWARRDAQRCWRVTVRVKRGTEVANVGDWSAISELPSVAGTHDREPCAYRAKDGKLTLYFSSTRDGSWSIWNAEMDPANLQVRTPVATTKPPYSDRAPTVFDIVDTPAIVYRSGRPVTYRNLEYAASPSEDIRYCGSTTLRTGNREQVARMGKATDCTAYTHDAGRTANRTDSELVARDTLGIYAPSNVTPEELSAGRRQLDSVLGEFLPATTRAVVLPNEEPT